jgi:hypothetical protein
MIGSTDQNRVNKENDLANGALIMWLAGNMITAHPFEDFQGPIIV